ncbi:Hpt domain-containing protein [bacterium]|nr:Hpt domain-containing protein [candidate division CSSED10-310 bacterium]
MIIKGYQDRDGREFLNASKREAEHPNDSGVFNEMTTERILSQDRSLLEEFIAETRNQCHAVKCLFLALAKDPENKELINTIFMAFHTIKSAAGYLQLTDINNLAHAAESLISMTQKMQLQFHISHIDLLLEAGYYIVSIVEQVEKTLQGEGYQRIQGVDSLITHLESSQLERHCSVEGTTVLQ